MKTLSLTLFTVLSYSLCQAENKATDEIISSYLIGKWEHISSTYPWGDVVTYHREIELSKDGKGICTKYQDNDTIAVNFEWEVKDSVIHLFVFNKRGKRINGDSQYISMVNLSKLYLKDLFSEERTGKVACYRRTTVLEGAKF